MSYRFNVTDYDSDWALKERNVDPRETEGYLTREDIVASCGSLGVDEVEVMHAYWEDCSSSHLRKIWADVGLPVFSYIFFVDLAVPADRRQQAVDQTFRLIDRTAELGASRAMIVPATAKPEFSLQEQRSWLIEGLRRCAEYSLNIGVTLLSENCEHPTVRALMGRGSDCAGICKEIDSPGFRLIYDPGCCALTEEDPIEMLHVVRSYIAHVHLKNRRAVSPGEAVQRYLVSDGGQRYTGSLMDRGVVNIREVLSELKMVNYNGPILVEYQGETDPRQAVPACIQYLRELS